MIEIILTDDTITATLPKLEIRSYGDIPIEGTYKAVTLDNNVSTYFTVNKRQWSHRWSRLTKAQYNIIKGFYDRQFQLTILKYPLLTIAEYGVSNVPVDITLSYDSVVNSCGDVSGVSIILRETSN